MICHLCQDDPCSCPTKPLMTGPILPPTTPAYDHRGAISRDEFGQALYACIKAFAGRNWLRTEYRRLVTDLHVEAPERKRRLEALRQREHVVELSIHDMMPKLTLDDQRKLLTRFEQDGAA